MSALDATAKRIVITGAASGIAQATLAELQRRGARVVGLDLHAEEGGELIACDVRDQASVDRAVAAAIERLGGGTVNEVYRVDSAAGSFVLRLDGAAWRRPGVDRARELILHRAAAAIGIAPALVAAEPQARGLLVMEFVPGRLWDSADYDDVDALRRLGERLYALHQLPPPAIEAFDPWRVAQGYLRQIDAAHTAALERPLRRLRALSAELHTGQAAMTVVRSRSAMLGL